MVLENKSKGREMIPELYTKFCAAIDEHAHFLTKTLNTTITYLAEQEKGMLSPSIASLLQQHALTLQLLDKEKLLVCGSYTAIGETKTLLLFSHCPPQHSVLARWETFVTHLLTFALYSKTIGSIPLNIVWLIDTEEHTEDNTRMSSFVESNRTLFRADGCLYALPPMGSLPAPFLALGTKGVLSIEVGVYTNSSEQHSLHGAILPDAAWRLTWALNSLKDAREDIRIEGFYDTLVPMGDEEIALLRNMADNELALQQRMNVDDFLLHLHGFQLYYTHLLLPTCTVTSIHSGKALEFPHTIPSFAQASLDIHLVPDQEPEDIALKLRAYLDTQGFQDVSTRIRTTRSPQYTSLRHPFTKTVYNSTHALYGENIPTFPLLPQNIAYYPFSSRLNIPVVYTQLGYSQSQLYERDTVMTGVDEERQKQFLVKSMKQLAMIIEGMIDASDFT